ncbi:MAG: PucR family transcriptional regulator ligand-binding domain-containing protein [Herpetosiphon sp.]
MSITVAQALTLDVLRNNEVRAGQMGLQRTVDHVRVLDSVLTNDPVAEHDRVLYLADLPTLPYDAKAQCTNIRLLAEHRCAGLVYQPAHEHKLFPEALALADRIPFPMIELTGRVPYNAILTAITRTLNQETNATLKPDWTLQVQMIDLVLHGFGLDYLVRATAEHLRRPVLVLSGNEETMSACGLDELQRQQWQHLIARNRPARLRFFDLLGTTGADRLCVYPLPGAQRPGWLAIGHDLPLGPQLQAALEQAVAIIAIELMHHKTVAEARQSRQGELLDAILSDRCDSEEQLLREANQIGWDLRRCRAVLVVRTSSHGELVGPGQAVLRTVNDVVRQANPASVVWQRSNDLIVLASLQGTVPAMQSGLRELSQAIHLRFLEDAQHTCVVAGGSLVDSPLALGMSYRAALSALQLRMTILSGSQVINYEDAKLLIMLGDFAKRPEVRTWLGEQLSVLIDYDRRNKTDLVHTLEVALDQGGVLTITAEQLSIHPNTLKYRLQRIEEIIEHNPMSSPHRLAYHIAAKLARLLP